MPITVNHVLTATTPDDPAYEIRPSHWNSAHVAVMSATAGTEVFGAFSNDPAFNVSFSTNAGGQVVASANVTAAPSPVNVTGANGSSVNAQTIAFSNANGVTLGVSTAANGATITGSHNALTSQSNQAFSASGGSSAFQTLGFSNANGFTFSNSNGSVVGSYTVPTQSQQPMAASAENGSFTANTLSFSNANGISFGTSAGSAITASHNAITTARASNDGIGLNTAQSNVTWTVNSSGLSLDARGYAGTATSVTGGAAVTLNSNGLAFNGASLAGTSSGFTGANISASITHNTAGLALSMSVAAGGGANFSAGVSTGGNTSGDTGITGTRMVFAGGNNITLSQATDANGATITFSGANAGGAQTGISGIVVSNTTYTSGTVSFSNANGISFGSSAGQAITASYTVPSTAGLISAVGVTGQNGNFTTTGLSFSNANGVSFGTSAGSAITASVAAQTNQTIGGYFVGNTTGQSSSSTVDARSFSFDGAGIVSAGWSNGTVRISATQSNQAFSAGAASSTFQTLSLQDSNGVSFSNNAGAIRVTHALAGTATAITGLASMTVNSGGISFNGTGLAGTGTTFNGANISGSMTVNTAGVNLSMSVAAPGGAASQTLYATGNTTVNSSGTVALSSVLMRGYGVLSLGTSNGSVLFSTPDPVTLAPNWYAVGNTTGASSSTTLPADTISIQGAGGVSVGYTNGSIVISGGAGGGVTPVASASNGSFSFTTLAFSNANNVTFGTSAGSIITASVAAPGAAAENNWVNLLGANTAGNTTASGSTIGYSGINLTLSGTNGSVVNISAPATSSLVGASGLTISTAGSTISIGHVLRSYFDNVGGFWANSTTMTMRQSTSAMIPMMIPGPISFGFVRMPITASQPASTTAATTGNSQFSYGTTRTHNFVLYSRGTGASSQSLQSLASTSFTDQQSINVSANANSTQFSYSNRATYYSEGGTFGTTFDYSSSAASLNFHTSNMTGYSGLKMVAFPWATSLSAGQYWLAYGVSTSTASQFAAAGSVYGLGWSNYGASQPNLAFGTLGSASNSSVMPFYGMGSFTTNAQTTASLGFTAISSSSAHNRPIIILGNIA